LINSNKSAEELKKFIKNSIMLWRIEIRQIGSIHNLPLILAYINIPKTSHALEDRNWTNWKLEPT
jgi:hypothetical protein